MHRMKKDFAINIAASFIYLVATQGLVYPFLARAMSAEEYGMVLMLMGIANTVGVALGNPLNNTRILLQKEYSNNGLVGDYTPIFSLMLMVNVTLVTVLSTIVYKGFRPEVLGCAVISALVLFRAYFTVAYRIKIDYKKFLFSNLSGFLGYLLGILVTSVSKSWVFAFIMGELFSCSYIFLTSDVVRDAFHITSLFRVTINKYSLLLSASAVSSAMIYMDRFFLYPVLGPSKVAIYNVASVFGKIAALAIGPIAGVLLTYYAKEERISLGDFFSRTSVFAFGIGLSYVLVLLVGRPALRMLYPTIANSAMPYFAIANGAVALYVFGQSIQPTLLGFCNTKWQPIVQSIYLFIYFPLGFFCMSKFGLMGFCYSVLISNTVRILLMISVIFVSLSYQTLPMEKDIE